LNRFTPGLTRLSPNHNPLNSHKMPLNHKSTETSKSQGKSVKHEEKTRIEYHANGDRKVNIMQETTSETGPVFEKSREVKTFGVGERKESWRRKIFARVKKYGEARKAKKAKKGEEERNEVPGRS
jgi:hypothetical protein